MGSKSKQQISNDSIKFRILFKTHFPFHFSKSIKKRIFSRHFPSRSFLSRYLFPDRIHIKFSQWVSFHKAFKYTTRLDGAMDSAEEKDATQHNGMNKLACEQMLRNGFEWNKSFFVFKWNFQCVVFICSKSDCWKVPWNMAFHMWLWK